MNLQTTNSSWEQRLFALAHDTPFYTGGEHSEEGRGAKDRMLADAFTACEAITAEYSRSFYLASGLLPAGKRQAMRALYAFCRTADNLADDGVAQADRQLAELRAAVTGSRRHVTRNPVLTAWMEIQKHYQIPLCYAEQLLDGVACDLDHQRYRTFEELSVYCYGVASTVGLMSMHITGFSTRQAFPYAIKLGVALQLTNILRDVGEDWAAGRLYLPLEELAMFGLAEKDVAAGQVDGRWRDFMRFQIARARRLYDEALPGIAMLHPDGRLSVAAAAFLYRGILDDIEAHDDDVFHRRAFVSRGRKIALLARAFAFSKTGRE